MAAKAEVQPPKGEVLTAKAEAKSQGARSVVPLRGVPGLGRGAVLGLFRVFGRGFGDGFLLFRALLSGPDTFFRACRAIVYPALQRFAEGLVPYFFRSFFLAFFRPFGGPFVGFVTQWGLTVIRPIYGLITYFIGLNFLGHLAFFINPELFAALVPFLSSSAIYIQNLFATPAGVSVGAVFLEQGVKIFTGSIFFGGFCNNFSLLFFPPKPEKGGPPIEPLSRGQRIRFIIYMSVFGVSVLLVLLDHVVISFFVQKTIQAFPSVGELATRPLGPASLLLTSSVVLQSSGFPPIVTFFYASLLYASELYAYFLRDDLPFSNKKSS